jgi:uncharacterized membrane protein
MNKVNEFIKTTLIGGLLIVLPIVVIFVLVGRAAATVRTMLEPIMSRLPEAVVLPGLIALLIVVAGCFIAGLVVRTGIGQRVNRAIERTVLERIPGYGLLRSITRRVAGAEEGQMFAVALATFEGALVPAFVVEEHDDGRYTVFVPAVPTPGVGALYILPRERVHLVDIPFTRAVSCISQWGAGSRELLRAMRRG